MRLGPSRRVASYTPSRSMKLWAMKMCVLCSQSVCVCVSVYTMHTHQWVSVYTCALCTHISEFLCMRVHYAHTSVSVCGVWVSVYLCTLCSHISVCLCICVHSDSMLTSQIAWYQPKSLLNREIDRSQKGKCCAFMCLYLKCEALPFCLVLNYTVPSCCHLVKIENIYTLKLIFLHSSPHTNLWEGSGNIKLSNLKCWLLTFLILK